MLPTCAMWGVLMLVCACEVCCVCVTYMCHVGCVNVVMHVIGSGCLGIHIAYLECDGDICTGC